MFCVGRPACRHGARLADNARISPKRKMRPKPHVVENGALTLLALTPLLHLFLHERRIRATIFARSASFARHLSQAL